MIKIIKRYAKDRGRIVIIDNQFEFSMPYVGPGNTINVALTIDLNKLIDGYDYHDAPGSVELYLDDDDLRDLKELAELLLQKIEELEKKGD